MPFRKTAQKREKENPPFRELMLDNLLKWTKSQIGKLNVVYQDFDIVGNIASVIEIFNLVA